MRFQKKFSLIEFDFLLLLHPRLFADLSKSVFKDYRPDTHQLLMDCFDYDWKISKIAKFVKEPA